MRAAFFLGIACLLTAPVASEAVGPEPTLISAFEALCLVPGEGHYEDALERADREGDARIHDLVVRSHSPWPATTVFEWHGSTLQIAWRDEHFLCGIVDAPITQREAFEAALSERLGQVAQLRTESPMPGVIFPTGRGGSSSVSDAEHMVWSLERNGLSYEVVSYPYGRGPHPVIREFNGARTEEIVDDRRFAVWLRRAPAGSETLMELPKG